MENNLKDQHYKNMGIRPEMDTLTFEAESVAYIVSEHLGIDSSQYSFGYVVGWSEGRDLPELKACLSVIHDTAAEIIEQIDSELKLTLKPEAEKMEQVVERHMQMTI